VDIGFNDGGVHSHLAALHDLVLHRQFHHAPMNLFDYFRAQRQCLAAKRFGVGHFAGVHASELPI
jgi:hypothetical protein